jgi:hypothetical protein
MENVPASPGDNQDRRRLVQWLPYSDASRARPIRSVARGERELEAGTPLRSGNEMASSQRRRGFNWKRPVPWIGCGAAHTAEEADVAASEDLQKDPRFGS